MPIVFDVIVFGLHGFMAVCFVLVFVRLVPEILCLYHRIYTELDDRFQPQAERFDKLVSSPKPRWSTRHNQSRCAPGSDLTRGDSVVFFVVNSTTNIQTYDTLKQLPVLL